MLWLRFKNMTNLEESLAEQIHSQLDQMEKRGI
jgi:hypothetical protein